MLTEETALKMKKKGLENNINDTTFHFSAKTLKFKKLKMEKALLKLCLYIKMELDKTFIDIVVSKDYKVYSDTIIYINGKITL